jgi:hypothetical protein
MKDLANGLHDCTIFLKIDLEKGYHQITAAAEDLPKTAIIMPLALFTSFGLSNAAQTFQRMIDRTVNNLEAVFAYMDDSWVGSPDRQAHLIHLEHFSPPWLPMALPSPWKNVFLHFQPWKFLITQFQWRVCVMDPGKGGCADPVDGGAFLGKGGPGLKGGNKERQLCPNKERDKT